MTRGLGWLARLRAYVLDDSEGRLNPSRLTALTGLAVWVFWAIHLTLDLDPNQPGTATSLEFIGGTAVAVLGVNLGQFITKQVADYKERALTANSKEPPNA